MAFRARLSAALAMSMWLLSMYGALGLDRRWGTSAFSWSATWLSLSAARARIPRLWSWPARPRESGVGERIVPRPPLPLSPAPAAPPPRLRPVAKTCAQAAVRAEPFAVLALALAAEAAVTAPLAAHYARNPERLFAGERGAFAPPAARPGADAAALAQNVSGNHAAFFFLHGDLEQRPTGTPRGLSCPRPSRPRALRRRVGGPARRSRAGAAPSGGLFLRRGPPLVGRHRRRCVPDLADGPYVLVLAGLGAENSPRRSGRSAAARGRRGLRGPARRRGVGRHRIRTLGASRDVGERSAARNAARRSRSSPRPGPGRPRASSFMRERPRGIRTSSSLLAPPGARRGPVVFFGGLRGGARAAPRATSFMRRRRSLRAGLAGGADLSLARAADPGPADVHELHRLSPTEDRETSRQAVASAARKGPGVSSGRRAPRPRWTKRLPPDVGREPPSRREGKSAPPFAPDHGGACGRVLRAALEAVGEVRAPSRGRRRVAPVRCAERVDDEARGGKRRPEEQVEDAPGARAVGVDDAGGAPPRRRPGPRSRRRRRGPGGRLRRVLERERGDGPAARASGRRARPSRGRARGESCVEARRRGPGSGSGGRAGASLRPSPARPQEGRWRLERTEEARGAGPGRRVRAEAVEENDGALGRQRPEHPDGYRYPSSAAKTSRCGAGIAAIPP